MPPRSGAPPQITFCLEYPALNRPASNQLVSNRPASLPPPGRQVPGSERSKAPIRRHDSQRAFPCLQRRRERRRAASRPVLVARIRREKPSASNLPASNYSTSNHPAPNLCQSDSRRAASAARRLFGGTTSQRAFPGLQRRRERRRATSRPVPAARIRHEKPSASNLPASNYSASNHPVPTSARAAGTGQRAQQGAYSEARRACKLSQAFSADESTAAQRVVRCLPPASASNTPPPRTVRPLFILHAPSHTAAPFHSSRRTAASPSAGWPRAHPPP